MEKGCIISIMREVGGNVNRLLPGVHVDERKEGQRARKVVGPPPGQGDVRVWWPLKYCSARGEREVCVPYDFVVLWK